MLHLFCTSEKSNVPLDHAFLFNSCLEHYRYKKISTIYLQEMKINDESINAIHLENYCLKGF